MIVQLPVQNIKCNGCASHITDKLSQLENIEVVEIDVESNIITLEHNDAESLTKAQGVLQGLGYPMIDDKNTILDKSKSYVSCMIGRVKK